MHSNNSPPPDPAAKLIPWEARRFYREGMEVLKAAGVPVLLGGARTLHFYTGIERESKDLDLLLRGADLPRAIEAARRAGYRAEVTFPHWLGKIHEGDEFIDLIYRAGNGLCEVRESWWARARESNVLGLVAQVCPPEEMILMKAYVMERERYDGADIAHLFHACAADLDYAHLLRIFGDHWPLLLSQVLLFTYIYPGHRDRIPSSFLQTLLDRAADHRGAPPAESDMLCRGTFLSREQFLPDIHERGYEDARLHPHGAMTAAEIAHWTAAIDGEG